MPLVLAIYGLMSLATAALYAWDKRCASRGCRRTPERTLHAMALLGGWPGALVAQQLFRHKRRKNGFMLMTAGIVLLHGVGWWIACK
jgi:uncharacterized membrane protein YsdA (DUF1294 family)